MTEIIELEEDINLKIITERNHHMKEIAQEMEDLHEISTSLSFMLNEQGERLENICN